MRSVFEDYFWTDVYSITTDKGIFNLGPDKPEGEVGADVSFFAITDNGVELITARLLKVNKMLKQIKPAS